MARKTVSCKVARQALWAMVHHTEMIGPIESTNVAIEALRNALKPRKTGRKPAVNASDVAKVREHIASGGTWKTLRLPVSEGTYYQIRAGRGVYGEVK